MAKANDFFKQLLKHNREREKRLLLTFRKMVREENAKTEKRININTDQKILASETRLREYVRDYVGEVGETIVKGMDKMFSEKEERDQKRYEQLKGEINLGKTEQRELKNRVSVLESQVSVS